MASQIALKTAPILAEFVAASPQHATPLLAVKNLAVSYGRQEVVHNVGFEIGRGESLALIGESGSGKSTIAKAVLRLLPNGANATGQVVFDRQNILALPERRFRPFRGREIGFVPQDPGNSLNPVRTIGSQALEALRSARHLFSKHSPRWVSTIRNGSTIPIRINCPAGCCSAC
jgi:peptide/nickel transport system ATP-binding protein